jgi:acetyl esterase/lipase
MVLEAMTAMELPPLEAMTVEEARAFMKASAAVLPPGPAVAEVVDGVLPGAAEPLEYRLYRPASTGPHPIVAYFHGGGWVLGDLDSDDALCRDLCVRSDAVLVSVNYRHAPEARFPAAAEDGFAAVQWIATHATELGGIPGQLGVAGWSAGANVAAVACQLSRDAGEPPILGQVLLMPVTDSGMDRPSYTANAEGYGLTAAVMKWFWDHYVDPAERHDPKASPLRGDLSNLPPTLIVTAEFDPLHDEGLAYAEALTAAGVPIRHLSARGHVHNSLPMVDVVLSGAALRAEIADALRGFFPAPVPA